MTTHSFAAIVAYSGNHRAIIDLLDGNLQPCLAGEIKNIEDDEWVNRLGISFPAGTGMALIQGCYHKNSGCVEYDHAAIWDHIIIEQSGGSVVAKTITGYRELSSDISHAWDTVAWKPGRGIAILKDGEITGFYKASRWNLADLLSRYQLSTVLISATRQREAINSPAVVQSFTAGS